MSTLPEPLSLGDAAVWATIHDDDRYRVLDALVAAHLTLSETTLAAGRETRGHAHPWPEVYFFAQGAGTLRLDGEGQYVSPGAIVVVPADVHHQVAATLDLRMTFYCAFSGDATRQPPGRGIDAMTP